MIVFFLCVVNHGFRTKLLSLEEFIHSANSVHAGRGRRGNGVDKKLPIVAMLNHTCERLKMKKSCQCFDQ